MPITISGSSASKMMRKQRRDVAGILVIGKSTAGTFAENLAALEKRVETLESGQH